MNHCTDQGCEVSAVLRHGSYLRFGCLQFVFTVMAGDDHEAVDANVLKLTKKAKVKSKPPTEESTTTTTTTTGPSAADVDVDADDDATTKMEEDSSDNLK